jgi:ribosome modulation factor
MDHMRLTKDERDLLGRVCRTNGGGLKFIPKREATFYRLVTMNLIQRRRGVSWHGYVHTPAGLDIWRRIENGTAREAPQKPTAADLIERAHQEGLAAFRSGKPRETLYSELARAWLEGWDASRDSFVESYPHAMHDTRLIITRK